MIDLYFIRTFRAAIFSFIYNFSWSLEGLLELNWSNSLYSGSTDNLVISEHIWYNWNLNDIPRYLKYKCYFSLLSLGIFNFFSVIWSDMRFCVACALVFRRVNYVALRVNYFALRTNIVRLLRRYYRSMYYCRLSYISVVFRRLR